MRGNFITDRSSNKNPNYKHGLRNTRLYSIYANMKSRCNNPKATYYNRYGGRGISICTQWSEFINFYEWAIKNGYNDSLTLDRIDNNGNYDQSNCRWIPIKEQSINRSTNHNITINDTTKSLIEWCYEYDINYKTVQDRLKRGWSYEKSLTTPVNVKFRRNKYDNL